MKFKLEIDMDNAAFDDAPMTELAHILRRIAAKLEDSGDPGRPRDANGNTVGTAKFTGRRA